MEATEVPRDVYLGSRLSQLSYIRFEDNERNKREIEANARLLGFDAVEYACENHPPHDAQAVIFINSKTGKAWVAFRGSEGAMPDPLKIHAYYDRWRRNPRQERNSPDDANVKDWATNLTSHGVYRPEAFGNCRVHAGFDGSVDSIYKDIAAKLEKHHIHDVSVTGHSQGAGDAQIAAPRLATDKSHKFHVDGVYLYEAPAVAETRDLAARYRQLGITNVNRVENKNDIVPRLASGSGSSLYGMAAQNWIHAGVLTQLQMDDLKERLYDPYRTAIGGRNPAHPEQGVGNLYYVNSRNEVCKDPPGHEVVWDKMAVSKAAGTDVFHSLMDNHFGFERRLYWHLAPEIRNEYHAKFIKATETAERQLYGANPGNSTADQRVTWEAEWNAGKRELRGTEEMPLKNGKPAMDESDWVWHTKHDRRHDIRFDVQGGQDAANGKWQSVTASFRYEGNSIDWVQDARYVGRPFRNRAGSCRDECLVPPEFGADPAEPRNRTSAWTNNADWKRISEYFTHSREIDANRPVTFTIARNSHAAAGGTMKDDPPSIMAKDVQERFVFVPPAAPRPVYSPVLDQLMGRPSEDGSLKLTPYQIPGHPTPSIAQPTLAAPVEAGRPAAAETPARAAEPSPSPQKATTPHEGEERRSVRVTRR